MEPRGALVSWTTVERGGEEVTFGLIRIEGSDTEMLHYVDTGTAEPKKGMALVPSWADEPTPDITAIVSFVPA